MCSGHRGRLKSSSRRAPCCSRPRDDLGCMSGGVRVASCLLVWLPAGVMACSSPTIPSRMRNTISAIKILEQSQKCLKNLLQHYAWCFHAALGTGALCSQHNLHRYFGLCGSLQWPGTCPNIGLMAAALGSSAGPSLVSRGSGFGLGPGFMH